MTATATMPAPSIVYTGMWHQFVFREIESDAAMSLAELTPLIEREQDWLLRMYEREYGPLAPERRRWVIDTIPPAAHRPRQTTRVSLLPLVGHLPARPLPPDALTYDDDTEDPE